MSYYTGEGDYYSGKGDPGLRDFFGSVVSTVGKVAGAVLPGPAGAVARYGTSVASRVIRGKTTSTPSLRVPSGGVPAISRSFGPSLPTSRPATSGTCGGQCESGFHLDKTTGSKCVRNRRTNYTNPRALSRAAKRLDGFVGVARKALKSTNYKVVNKSYKQNWRKPLKK